MALVKVIANTDVVDSDYLYFYFQSSSFQRHILQHSSRAAQAGFSKADFSDFKIRLPGKDIQIQTARKLSSQMHQCANAKSALVNQFVELKCFAASVIFESLKGRCVTTALLGDVCKK